MIDNLAVLRAGFDGLERGDVDGCLCLLTPDFVINLAEMPRPKHGREAWREHARSLLDAFDDVTIEVLDSVSASDLVAVRVRISGTHTGELMGAAPTGRRVSWLSHEFYRFEHGRIAEEWICSDSITMLTGIGALSDARLAAMWFARYRTWAGLGLGVVLGAGLATLRRRTIS